MKWWESILTLKRKFNWKKIQFGVVMMEVSVKLIVKGINDEQRNDKFPVI